MNYSTLNQFQGAWLGSIIGSALSDNVGKSDYHQIIDSDFQDWVEIRNTVAQIAIENKPVKPLFDRLTKILSKDYLNSFDYGLQNTTGVEDNGFQSTQKQNLISYYCRVISLLLPLIIIQADRSDLENLYTEVIAKCHSNSEIAAEIRQDITIWNCIINKALTNQFQLEEPNVSMMVKQVLSGVEVKTTSLVTKLEIVGQAWKSGLSLEQLTQRLYQQENSLKEIMPTASGAIALSFYCFASTPRNFMFSVQRATNINSTLFSQIPLLTASISGAYNGVSGIPRNWLKAASNHQPYRLAKETIEQLYQVWLGVYHPDDKLLSPSKVNVVAAPQIFQIRQNMKIISQKSGLG